ncbi:DUF2235 domain-containing protein [Crenobacter cavernae]|uniref:DUF2235 domain-containing protein n=1 Tax=Crenobacter cavernae TaxID=2290923 RepID=A0ABY0FDT5_9NEIS|nr:DUF2235 domain-containing protein [Crenobacter cavernae]RXZ44387.1 DUF2235 domain-containing protein [Crenobacter cavernae]
MAKDIAVFMDGTWNNPDAHTNVYRLFGALRAGPEQTVDEGEDPLKCAYRQRTGDSLIALYLDGVGSSGEDRVAGGFFGAGLHRRVMDAFLLVSRHYVKGDRIWLFGFSRGAWSARSLASFIASAGLLTAEELDAGAVLARLEARSLWLQTKAEAIHNMGKRPRGEDFWAANDEKPIQLVGVWDTVGALGVPFFNGMRLIDLIEKLRLDFADLSLSERVRYGRHAMAIDEQREDFVPAPWTPRADWSIRQVWFPGVHADVGGGYPEKGLSDITLSWMAAEVASLEDPLPIDLNQLLPAPAPLALQDRHDEAQKPLWQLRPLSPRRIPDDGLLAPEVKERFDKRDDYRPPSLKRHPQTQAYYKPPIKPEKIFPPDAVQPAVRLAPGEALRDYAFASRCWNATCIAVTAGERYRIDAADGMWKDKDYEVSADGYDSPNLIMKAAEKMGMRRLEDAPWFCLVACVNADAALEANNPDAGSVVTGVIQSLTHSVARFDESSQLQAVGKSAELRVDRDGYLYLFANDASWAYANNTGSLVATVTRLS